MRNTIFIFLLPVVSASREVLIKARSLGRHSELGVNYGNFILHRNSYLNVVKVSVLFVTRVRDCAVECVSTCPCVSFNIAVQSDPEKLGHFRCELLANDTYRVSGNFSSNAAFHHFSLVTECRNQTCVHGGTCAPNYEEDTFYCICRAGYGGTNCQQIHGGWTSWSAWSGCTKGCGGGTRTRSRSCTNPSPSNGGQTCVGLNLTTEVCNTQNCPVHGGWTNWSAWSGCTKGCGGGSRTRSRSCNNPSPAYGGHNCAGASSESGNCNMQECLVHGGWTSWTAWSACTKSCGGGSRTRSRSCTNPLPAHGGQNCAGASSESGNCNTKECPGICDVEPSARTDCGWAGLTERECTDSGCCFNSLTADVPWCFKPNRICDVQSSARIGCGWAGITARECTDKNCCYNSLTPDVPWCFKPND